MLRLLIAPSKSGYALTELDLALNLLHNEMLRNASPVHMRPISAQGYCVLRCMSEVAKFRRCDQRRSNLISISSRRAAMKSFRLPSQMLRHLHTSCSTHLWFRA
jgi:hypothetical protein